jgi:hypothetical protein
MQHLCGAISPDSRALKRPIRSKTCNSDSAARTGLADLVDVVNRTTGSGSYSTNWSKDLSLEQCDAIGKSHLSRTDAFLQPCPSLWFRGDPDGEDCSCPRGGPEYSAQVTQVWSQPSIRENGFEW